MARACPRAGRGRRFVTANRQRTLWKFVCVHALALKLAVTVVVLATPAFAQPAAGTGGDPVRELMVDPAFAYTDLPSGLPVRGGDPEDTVLLFDGFALPWMFHGSGLRSILPPGAASVELVPGAFDVEHGRGSSLVMV